MSEKFIVDLEEVARVNAWRNKFFTTPIEYIVWRENGKELESPPEDVISEWEFTGLGAWHFAVHKVDTKEWPKFVFVRDNADG